jgi:hypothetical protein
VAVYLDQQGDEQIAGHRAGKQAVVDHPRWLNGMRSRLNDDLPQA